MHIRHGSLVWRWNAPLALTEKKREQLDNKLSPIEAAIYPTMLMMWQERKAASSVMSALSTVRTHNWQLQLTVSAAQVRFSEMW